MLWSTCQCDPIKELSSLSFKYRMDTKFDQKNLLPGCKILLESKLTQIILGPGHSHETMP